MTSRLLTNSLLVILALAACSMWTRPAIGALDPALACQAKKLKAAGKDASCQATQIAKGVTGKLADFAKCAAKLADNLAKAEEKGGCLTSGEATVIDARNAQALGGVAQLLGGVRFIDNGDGTVTDTTTGLMWEKKVAGSGCTHCVDDQFTFASAMGDWVGRTLPIVHDQDERAERHVDRQLLRRLREQHQQGGHALRRRSSGARPAIELTLRVDPRSRRRRRARRRSSGRSRSARSR